MPTIEERIIQTEKILDFFDATDLEGKDLAFKVYNNAIEDVVDAIDVYIDKNPQHTLSFRALKEEIDSWMPLVKS